MRYQGSGAGIASDMLLNHASHPGTFEANGMPPTYDSIALAIKTLPEGSGLKNRVPTGPDDHRDGGRAAKDICDPPPELADR